MESSGEEVSSSDGSENDQAMSPSSEPSRKKFKRHFLSLSASSDSEEDEDAGSDHSLWLDSPREPSDEVGGSSSPSPPFETGDDRLCSGSVKLKLLIKAMDEMPPAYEPSASSYERKEPRTGAGVETELSESERPLSAVDMGDMSHEWEDKAPLFPSDFIAEGSPCRTHNASPGPTEDLGSASLLLKNVLNAPEEETGSEIDKQGVACGSPLRSVGDERFLKCCGYEEQFLSQKQTSSALPLLSSETEVFGEDDFFGLGEKVKRALFTAYQIDSLHPWQNEMLQKHVKDEKNALVVAPTSGGKTLVALILILRAMVLQGKDCFLVQPYVAIVSEKVQELRRLAKELPWIRVSEYAGSKGQIPLPKQKASMRTLYVCTPEKATAMWKMLCADGNRREEIGFASVDECHMLGDNPRGAVVEELLVSLLFWSSSPPRILALSATVGNPQVIARFLGGGDLSRCTVHHVTGRPTKLKEHVIVTGAPIPILRDGTGKGSICFEKKGQDLLEDERDKAVLECPSLLSFDDKVCAKLVFETVQRGESLIVFCGTRTNCMSVCAMLTSAHKSLNIDEHNGNDDVSEGVTRRQTRSYLEEITRQRELVVGHLKNESRQMVVDNTLLAGISVGIGYHTAALHPTERKAVEDSFRRNIISVLCCTTTLATGVNLPANRVIIRSPRVGPSFLSCAQYLQMVGRSRRTKHGATNTEADSFIFIQPNDCACFQDLIERPAEDVVSRLNQVSSYYQVRTKTTIASDPCTGVTRVILGSILMKGMPMRLSELIRVYQHTLLYQTSCVVEENGAQSGKNTLRPFIHELVVLLELESVLETVAEADQPVTSIRLNQLCLHEKPETDQFERSSSMIKTCEKLSDLERRLFLERLQGEIDSTIVPDYSVRLTTVSAAASAASVSVSDAQHFVKEAEQFETQMPLQNPLVILYLSITETMSLELVQDVQYRAEENSKRNRIINKLILRNFQKHPDAAIFSKLGVLEEMLTEWVYGNPTVLKNVKFTEKLTRLWSAYFLKQVLQQPDNLEELCTTHGFERPTALDMSSALASRCQNLRLLCSKLGRFWWYPPLSSHLIKSLANSCEEQYRPLLKLRHVTIERAKSLYELGLRSVEDVAAIFPPTLLSDSVHHMSRWMAVELVLDARDMVFQEAAFFAAESAERKKVLQQQ